LSRLILALGLTALAACAAPPPPVPGLRQDGPIWSSAVFDLNRMEGEWQQAAVFVRGGRPACGPGGVLFQGGQVTWALCLEAGPSRGTGPATPGLPGRFALPGMADWWVLWIDADDRTALIGTPGGEFGFVLNRGGALPEDRLKAASDIAVFNGYRAEDLARF
jgi:apolipoprotein D and lipocalin family protein